MPSVNHTSLGYNPTIDGLRAVAVISVLLYHVTLVVLGESILPGLFLGVDIFFVISGYLMAEISSQHLRAGIFSVGGFLDRRIRRLVPALFCVLLLSCVLAYLLLYPAALERFGPQLFASSLFLSNIELWQQADVYFAVQSTFLPLLHTWSLGVEMSYYFFIALLAAIFGNRKRIFWGVVLVSAVTWLGFGDASNAERFYLLPYRLWEFAIGMALIFFPTLPVFRGRGLVYLLLLTLIGWELATYDAEYYHPSLETLPILLATAGILYLSRSNIHFMPIANVCMATIGKLSYSLYLWHWPLLVFAVQYSLSPLSMWHAMLLMAIAFVLSLVTWRFVETPCRRKDSVPALPFYGTVFVVLILFGFFANALMDSNGYSKRVEVLHSQKESLSPQWLELSQNGERCFSRTPDRACVFEGKRPWVVVGDSALGVLLPPLQEALQASGQGLKVLSSSGCRFHVSEHENSNCAGYNMTRKALLEGLSEKHTILLNTGEDPLVRDFLLKLKAEGHKVIVYGEVPEFNQNVPQTAMKQLLRADTIMIRIEKPRKENVRWQGLEYFDPSEVLCDELYCYAHEGDELWYTDFKHLSRVGAERVVRALIQESL